MEILILPIMLVLGFTAAEIDIKSDPVAHRAFLQEQMDDLPKLSIEHGGDFGKQIAKK